MLIETITPKELLETMKLSSICFDYPFISKGDSEEEHRDLILSSPTEKLQKYWDCQTIARDESNHLMACIAAIPLTFQFDGSFYSGNGIGNVCTAPQHRKKGAIRALLETMLLDSYQKGQIISYLYPFSEAFYNKFGYQKMQNSTCYQLKLTALPSKSEKGSFHLLTEHDTTLLEDFKLTYRNFSREYNLMLDRIDFDWSIITDAKASVNNNYAFLYKDVKGDPKGYIVFKKDGRLLRARELVFTDFKVLTSILNFMKSYATDFDFLQIYAPSTVPLDVVCKDFYTSGSSKSYASNGMVRILNVEQVLLQANYKSSGTCIIKIHDNFILENNKIFQVSFTNGVATSVSFYEHENNSVVPNIEMPISIFSASIVGNYKVSDFHYMEEVLIPVDNIKENTELLQCIFYYKNCFINNYF